MITLRHLSRQLGTPAARLREIARDIKRDMWSHYKLLPLVDKKKRKTRHLRIPRDDLKVIQRRIKTLLGKIALDQVVHGGVRGRSQLSNAASHLARRCVINIDVKDYFPNIRHYMVHRMLKKELGFGRDVAWLLTRLITIDSQVPQGAPTSTSVANLLLAVPLDRPISAKAVQSGLTYTRFVDDITLSGDNPRPLINLVGKMLSRRRLPMHRKKKLKITSRAAGPQEVTGLIVNSSSRLSVPRKYRDKIRAAIFQLRDMDGEIAVDKAVRSIQGKINYVRQFNPGAAKRMQLYLADALTRRRSTRAAALV